MSNKAQKRGLVPKLRFPEFREAGEWSNALLGKLLIGSPAYGVNAAAVPFADNLPKYLRITDISEGGQYLPDKQVSVDLDATDENYLDEGDIVLARTGASVGKSYRYRKEDGKLVFAGFLIRVKPDPMLLISTYLANYLTTDQFWKWVAVTSARSGQPGINSTEYSSLAIPLPPDFLEQQKIADCLASLDERVTLEAQKLDTLKTHKKGLMQQLFPAEGETLPKLRFPEFRDAGVWITYKFGEICKFVRGPFGGALTKDIFVKDGYTVYEQSHAIYQNFDSFRYFITENKFKELKRFSVQPNDIIMSCSGTMGKFAVIPLGARSGVINQALLKLTVNKGYDLNFTKFFLELPINQEKLLSQSAGGAIKNVVGVGELKEIVFSIPPIPEQKKIADCLSFLDDLITAQTQKLAALKTHKKGLMQQLFPSPEVIE